MKFGISDENYKVLNELVLQPLRSKGAEVFIFGSRASGKHHPYSDVDILFKVSSPLPDGFISELKEKIENSAFPYTVDLVEDKHLAESYKESVYKQLKSF